MKALLTQRFGLLVAVNLACWGVLGLYQAGDAAPPVKEPFANSVQQRADTITVLDEIKVLLAEQNDLLRSGNLKVTIQKDSR